MLLRTLIDAETRPTRTCWPTRAERRGRADRSGARAGGARPRAASTSSASGIALRARYAHARRSRHRRRAAARAHRLHHGGVGARSGSRRSASARRRERAPRRVAIEVIDTPGHTDDSVSYRVGGELFTGDALFVRGNGRTDFQNGERRGSVRFDHAAHLHAARPHAHPPRARLSRAHRQHRARGAALQPAARGQIARAVHRADGRARLAAAEAHSGSPAGEPRARSGRRRARFGALRRGRDPSKFRHCSRARASSTCASRTVDRRTRSHRRRTQRADAPDPAGRGELGPRAAAARRVPLRPPLAPGVRNAR